MKTINAGQLYDYAADEVALNSLLIENPGLTIENNTYFHRNMDNLLKSAMKAENYDFIYWVKDHDLPDLNMVSLSQIILNCTTKMTDPEQAAFLQDDIIKTHGDKIKQAAGFDNLSWGLLRSGFLNSSGNEKGIASLKEAFSHFLKDALIPATIQTVINESVAKNNETLFMSDLSTFINMVKPEHKEEARTLMFVTFATNNQVEHAKEMINLGVDPFATRTNLNELIESPSDDQRATINTLENYKFSLSDDKDDYHSEDNNTTGSFVL